jgi:hypothetical protein
MAADGGRATAALDEALKPLQERASEAEVRSLVSLTTSVSRRFPLGKILDW